MIDKDYYIDKDGFKLHAKLEFPKNQLEKMPLLILIHGLTGQMDETHLEVIKNTVNDGNIACLRVDMYGHGKSDGDFSNHNIMEWVCELIYIINYARTFDFVTDIYLAGHSQGGLTAILTAAVMADQVKSLILVSPATNIVYDCCKGIFFGTVYDKNHLPESVDFWDEYNIKSNYFRVARLIDIDKAISEYKGPVLVVHGTADDAVAVDYGVEVARKYDNAELTLIEGAGHCFDDNLDELSQSIKDFLDSVR